MKILKCPKGHYTMSEKCHVCGTAASTPHPPKFSPEKEERLGKYRRLGKRNQGTESEKSS